MVLLSVFARPVAVYRLLRASASAAGVTAGRPAAARPGRADRRDRRARAVSARGRRRASVRGGAAWMASSCHSCATARASRWRCVRKRRACFRGARSVRVAVVSLVAHGCTTSAHEPDGAQCATSARHGRIRARGGRRRRHSVRALRPFRRTCAVRPHRPASRASMDGVNALTYVAEIAAASVRVVTYPFPGCLQRDVLSSTPTARGSCPARPPGFPGAQAPCCRRRAGTALAAASTTKEVRS
ncbi:hypothetical protein BSTAB16_4058 [Burkholderia stabilis]|uniref:Uncharacterized protein n=1 Tax=Burkholderia stabilis TaxID=95485 RepID=A0AAJ5N8P4_9BURK|nr:hypothetical protein BSTAB16_4058 [Burkholderia stabilis]